jgi:hypothetical protein
MHWACLAQAQGYLLRLDRLELPTPAPLAWGLAIQGTIISTMQMT